MSPGDAQVVSLLTNSAIGRAASAGATSFKASRLTFSRA
jgi:hypothetical protein